MKNQPCVSREMAEKLRDAGYPQPTNGMFYALAAGYDTGNEVLEHFNSKPQPQFDPAYAPTATELLPDGLALMRHSETEWIAQNLDDPKQYAIGENPHDAAAMAWLRENRKEVQP